MTYELTIKAYDYDLRVHEAVLTAEFCGDTQKVLSARVDQENDGTLSKEGANAFRCLALADHVMRHALKLPEEPEELHVLRARVAELERALAMKEEMAA